MSRGGCNRLSRLLKPHWDCLERKLSAAGIVAFEQASSEPLDTTYE